MDKDVNIMEQLERGGGGSVTKSTVYTHLTQLSTRCSASVLSAIWPQTHTPENKRRKVKVNERCVSHLVLRHSPQMETKITSSLFLSSVSPAFRRPPPPHRALPLDTSCSADYLHIYRCRLQSVWSVCVFYLWNYMKKQSLLDKAAM